MAPIQVLNVFDDMHGRFLKKSSSYKGCELDEEVCKIISIVVPLGFLGLCLLVTAWGCCAKISERVFVCFKGFWGGCGRNPCRDLTMHDMPRMCPNPFPPSMHCCKCCKEQRTPQERLATLEEHKERGLITQVGYDRVRAEIEAEIPNRFAHTFRSLFRI